MQGKWINIMGIGVVLAGLALAGTGLAKSDGEEVSGGSIRLQAQSMADYPGLAKITLDQAIQFALAKVPGSVLGAELEQENDFLVYGVDVVGGDRTIIKVSIDAGTGKVLATEHEDEHDEEHEDHNDK